MISNFYVHHITCMLAYVCMKKRLWVEFLGQKVWTYIVSIDTGKLSSRAWPYNLSSKREFFGSECSASDNYSDITVINWDYLRQIIMNAFPVLMGSDSSYTVR